MKADLRAPIALRMLSVPLGLLGMGFVLLPLLARRPDGLLAAHPHQLSLWAQLGLHPVVGATMLVCTCCVWLRYSRTVLWLFWSLVILALLGAPVTVSFLVHYGK
jgi:hypothetical protein